MPAGPPVIVLGIDTPIGLAVVRELGREGIEVHGIARSPRGLGLHSRWLRRGYLREPDLVAQLVRIARDSGAPFLMTVSMGDALAMRAAYDDGRLGTLRPLLPPLDRLELVNDKAAICGIAADLGIETPSSWEPRSASSADIPALGYPCVLKWRDPEQVAGPLEALGLPLLKTEYAHDAAGLAAALTRYVPFGRYPLVQSYAAGTGLGQMFVMHEGRAVVRFQHRRLHEWPPEGGTSTVCESVLLGDNAALMERSEALLRAIGWEGPAMVEYRHDPASGRAVLMEINGRFWGSLPLAAQAGAPFALATYHALGLGRPLPTGGYRAGLRCRYMIPETKRLLVVTLRPHAIADRSLRFSKARAIASYLGGFVRLRDRYFVWSLADPKPFFADLAFIARGLLTSSRAHDRRPGRVAPPTAAAGAET